MQPDPDPRPEAGVGTINRMVHYSADRQLVEPTCKAPRPVPGAVIAAPVDGRTSPPTALVATFRSPPGEMLPTQNHWQVRDTKYIR